MSVFQTEPEVEWSPEFTSVANQLSATAESAYSFDDLQLRLGGVSTASIVVDFEKEAIEGMKAQLTAEFDSVGQVVAGYGFTTSQSIDGISLDLRSPELAYSLFFAGYLGNSPREVIRLAGQGCLWTMLGGARSIAAGFVAGGAGGGFVRAGWLCAVGAAGALIQDAT